MTAADPFAPWACRNCGTRAPLPCVDRACCNASERDALIEIARLRSIPADPLADIRARVRELVEDEKDGFWRSCTGCHETEDGHPVGHYPFSAALGCNLGGGCRECGGIGAVWDSTDYEDMARWMIRQDRTREAVATILKDQGGLPAYQAGALADEIMALDDPEPETAAAADQARD